MKKLALLLVVMMFCSVAIAEEIHDTTGDSVYRRAWLNKCFKHDHPYQRYQPKNALGWGANVTVLDLSRTPYTQYVDSLGLEYRYDYRNDLHSTYAVVNVDLTKVTSNTIDFLTGR